MAQGEQTETAKHYPDVILDQAFTMNNAFDARVTLEALEESEVTLETRRNDILEATLEHLYQDHIRGGVSDADLIAEYLDIVGTLSDNPADAIEQVNKVIDAKPKIQHGDLFYNRQGNKAARVVGRARSLSEGEDSVVTIGLVRTPTYNSTDYKLAWMLETASGETITSAPNLVSGAEEVERQLSLEYSSLLREYERTSYNPNDFFGAEDLQKLLEAANNFSMVGSDDIAQRLRNKYITVYSDWLRQQSEDTDDAEQGLSMLDRAKTETIDPVGTFIDQFCIDLVQDKNNTLFSKHIAIISALALRLGITEKGQNPTPQAILNVYEELYLRGQQLLEANPELVTSELS